jgi:hypothetical protein
MVTSLSLYQAHYIAYENVQKTAEIYYRKYHFISFLKTKIPYLLKRSAQDAELSRSLQEKINEISEPNIDLDELRLKVSKLSLEKLEILKLVPDIMQNEKALEYLRRMPEERTFILFLRPKLFEESSFSQKLISLKHMSNENYEKLERLFLRKDIKKNITDKQKIEEAIELIFLNKNHKLQETILKETTVPKKVRFGDKVVKVFAKQNENLKIVLNINDRALSSHEAEYKYFTRSGINGDFNYKQLLLAIKVPIMEKIVWKGNTSSSLNKKIRKKQTEFREELIKIQSNNTNFEYNNADQGPIFSANCRTVSLWLSSTMTNFFLVLINDKEIEHMSAADFDRMYENILKNIKHEFTEKVSRIRDWIEEIKQDQEYLESTSMLVFNNEQAEIECFEAGIKELNEIRPFPLKELNKARYAYEDKKKLYQNKIERVKSETKSNSHLHAHYVNLLNDAENAFDLVFPENSPVTKEFIKQCIEL